MERTAALTIVVTSLTALAFVTGCKDEGEGGAECGNGVIEGDEQCDGTAPFGATCEELGYQGGTLACASDCTYDESDCGDDCGNGAIDEGEDCDGTAPIEATCSDLGHFGGTLACASDCTYDESGCEEHCGNGAVDDAEGEVCDGGELGTEDCASQGFGGGTLACADDCESFDTTGCCDSQCTTEGEIECSERVFLRTCTLLESGCLDWVVVDCGTTTEVCNDRVDPPRCLAECFDACPTDGMTECMGNTQRTCSLSETLGCLDWHDVDCTATSQVCDASGEAAVCADP